MGRKEGRQEGRKAGRWLEAGKRTREEVEKYAREGRRGGRGVGG